MISGLFLDVVNISIMSSYLIAAVAVARLFMKKAPKNLCCILWLLVGIRLIMPFSFYSAFSLIPSGKDVNMASMTGSGAEIPHGADTASSSAYISEETIRALGYDDAAAESVNRPLVYLGIMSIIWLAGVFAMLIYMFISWYRIKKKVRAAVPCERGGIMFYQCENIVSPFLFGFFKARIYVPFGMESDESTLDYVLKHETMHRTRKDYLAKPIGYVILAVYWFNPLVWAAYILMCRDIELACDERVIRELGGGHKKEYADALLSCSVSHQRIAACPVAFGETGVKGRVKNILSYKKPALWVIILTIIVCIVIAICFMTEKKETAVADNLDNVQLEMNMTNGNLIADGANENIIIDGTDAKNVTSHNYVSYDAEEYLKQWAEAFCARDGKTILEMSDENVRGDISERQLLVARIGDNNERYIDFGWSSPWPWDVGSGEKNYRILEASDSEAVILYYAWTSDPHITVWREELSYKMTDNGFKITSEHLTIFDGICAADDFYKAYPNGDINNTIMDYYNSWRGETLNANAKNPNMAVGAYAGLDAPDTAAIKLLNILNNRNKVSVSVDYTNEEKTEAVVEFTFLEITGTAKVRMIKPYGDDSIWLPQTME